MRNIMRNTWTIFRHNKEFFYFITVQPVMIFLLMSFLLPYTTAHNIAVVNQADSMAGQVIEEALERLDGIKVQKIEADEVTDKLLGGNVELAVMLNQKEDGTPDIEIISAGSSEVEEAVVLYVTAAVHSMQRGIVTMNEVPEKGMTIANSLGFMIFKTLTSGNLLAALLIQERRRKMKERIMLSGVKNGAYIGGMALVYLLFMLLGSVVYYMVGLLLNFDFGMKNSLGFLVVLFTANVLSVSLYIYASTLVKTEDSLWFMASFVLLPMALFSGVLFPYEFMPEFMQKIGACCPQRWIAHGIETIQKTGRITSALPDMTMVLGLSAVLFGLAVVRSGGMKQKVA